MKRGDKYKLRYKKDTFDEIPFDQEWKLVKAPGNTRSLHGDVIVEVCMYSMKTVLSEGEDTSKYGFFEEFDTEEVMMVAFNNRWEKVV